jgi:hypothetical protein
MIVVDLESSGGQEIVGGARSQKVDTADIDIA